MRLSNLPNQSSIYTKYFTVSKNVTDNVTYLTWTDSANPITKTGKAGVYCGATDVQTTYDCPGTMIRMDNINLYTVPNDTSPPTPNPATFSSAPSNDSASQISMTATTASDDHPPIEYSFAFSACASNGGTGGTSSGWQASTSYSDSGLQPNQCYGYTVQSRDALSNTGTASSQDMEYTSANTPGAPTLDGATYTTLNFENDDNSNPTSSPTTYYAVYISATSPTDSNWDGKYVNASSQPSDTVVWITGAQADALVLGSGGTALASGTTYTSTVKARNEDGDETSYSSSGQGTTVSMGITVSGGCFTDATEGTACTDDGSDQIKVAINGTVDSGVDTTVDGSWSFTTSTAPASGAILTFFRDGESTESEEATTVIKYDGSGNVDNVKMYQNQLVIGADTGSANSDQTISNSDMDTATNGYENSDDEDVLVSVASDDLTLQSGNHLYVISGDTYRPGSGGGADVTVQNLYFEGTLTTDNNAVNVAGDFTNAGTFTSSTSTITFNGSAAQTFTTNGAAYNIVTLNNTGTDGANDNVTISGALDVNGAFNVTNGDLILTSGNPNVSTAGDVTIGSSAFVTAGSGTWTFDGASGTHTLTDSSTGGPQNLGAVVIDNGGSGNVVSTASNIKLTSLNITASDTLNITDDTLTITGSGTPFTQSGTFTATGSTVVYSGTSATNITATAYNNLTLTPASGSVAYSLAGNLTSGNAMTGTLTISSGATLDTTVSSYDITLAGNWSNSGTFTHNSNTVTFNGTTTGLTISDGGSAFYDLVFSGSGGEWLYRNGAAIAPNSTSVSNGTPTFLNAKTGTISVTGGTLNQDWYLGAHLVDAVTPATNIDTGDADVTILESGGASAVWRHNGSVWGTAAASQTSGTGSDGKNPQPDTAGAIRIREYSMTSSASCPGAGCTLYKYNLQTDWQTNYGEYDYYDDYGQNYLTSCLAGGAACGNDGSDDDVVGVSWYRSAPGTMNAPYDTLNDPPTKGSWYVGMLPSLDFALDSFDVDFGTITPGGNPTEETNTVTVTTSASHGYVVYARASQNMICSASAVCGAAEITSWPDGNDTPSTWNNGSFGFGYSTDDTNLSGGTADRFSGPKYAGFQDGGTIFGDPVADRTSPVSAQQNTITYRLAASGIQNAGPYQAVIVYVVAANY